MIAPDIIVELLNIDGSVIGDGRIKYDRAMSDAVRDTIGIGYDETISLPIPPGKDNRCPYQIRVAVHK